MIIKIKDNPSFVKLKPIAGQWIKVETDHLFTDQYNTTPFEGCDSGARVMDADVDRVINDARLGMGKCNYCGSMIKRGEVCNKYRDKEECTFHGIKWFTPENTYFLKYPASNSVRMIMEDNNES